MTCTIPLTRGYVALVDEGDYELLSKRNWMTAIRERSIYAVSCESRSNGGGTTYMHRLLVNAKKGEQVDHVNHNGLDNRRANLRICTVAQNRQNQRKTRGSSKYKGVCWHKAGGKWRAYIKRESRQRGLGCYEIEEDAARAYDRAAVEMFGEFASLNFPEELRGVA